MLTAALIAVALVAGLAGTWSPCGLSMVETLRPAGSRAAALGGALAFAAGALLGGAVTFGGLALLGTALGATGTLFAMLAAALLVVAALGDLAGRRIVPQVRRQVPESWRRTLPLSLASALYGVLLGLGFTTFVLSYATWGLAAATLAIGGPATGLAVGLAFGVGRALPIAWLAPQQKSGRAAEVVAAMGERPEVLRGLRVAAAIGLTTAAAALVLAPPAARAADVHETRIDRPSGGQSGSRDITAHQRAAATFQQGAADPSVSQNGRVVWQAADRTGRLLAPDGQVVALPGTDPAASDAFVAWLQDGAIVVADGTSLAPLRTIPAPRADALAISDAVLAWRSTDGPGRRDRIAVLDLADPASTPAVIRTAARGVTLGRPAAAGTRVLFDEQRRTDSRLLSHDRATGATTALRTARYALLMNPSLRDGRLLYVRSDYRYQRVLVGADRVGDGRADRALYTTTPTARRDSGKEAGRHIHRAGYGRKGPPRKPPRPAAGLVVTLSTTAFAGDAAYVTRVRHLRGGRTETRILRVGL